MEPRKLKYGEKQIIKAYYKFAEIMNTPGTSYDAHTVMKMLNLNHNKIIYAKGLIDNIQEQRKETKDDRND
jgi:hypothetical protein